MRALPVALSATFAFAVPVAAAPADNKPLEKAAEPAKPVDDVVQEAQGSLSGLFTAGNVQSIAGAASGYYSIKLWAHAIRFDLGAGATGLAQDTDTNPANGFEKGVFDKINTAALGKLRYDFFFTEDDTIYTSGLAAHDSATNLLARLRAEAGYRRYFFRADKHTFSGEIGGVYVIDNGPFDGDTNGDGAIDVYDQTRFENSGGPISGTFGARIMLQYQNAILENLAFSQTVEAVPNIYPDVEAPYESTRFAAGADGKLGIGEATTIGSQTSLVATLDKNLAAALTVNFVWDNGAIARRNAYSNGDLQTLITLSYKIF